MEMLYRNSQPHLFGKSIEFAAFSQKAQKRTALTQDSIFNGKLSQHFISLPEITYSVRFRPLEKKFAFHSLLIAHVKGGIPMFLPLHNVNDDGQACLYEARTRTNFPSIREMAEEAVSAFWNSKFDHSYEHLRIKNYIHTPLENFETWAKYTRKHPDWIPEPNVPLQSPHWFDAPKTETTP